MARERVSAVARGLANQVGLRFLMAGETHALRRLGMVLLLTTSVGSSPRGLGNQEGE